MPERLVDVERQGAELLHTFPVTLSPPADEEAFKQKALEAAGHAKLVSRIVYKEAAKAFDEAGEPAEASRCRSRLIERRLIDELEYDEDIGGAIEDLERLDQRPGRASGPGRRRLQSAVATFRFGCSTGLVSMRPEPCAMRRRGHSPRCQRKYPLYGRNG